MTCKILGMPVNTLAADEKYPFLNTHNLTTLIQMQICQKKKTFCEIFVGVLKSRLDFKDFQSKDDPHEVSIFEVTD